MGKPWNSSGGDNAYFENSVENPYTSYLKDVLRINGETSIKSKVNEKGFIS